MSDDCSITRRGFLCRSAATVGGALVACGPWSVVQAETPATGRGPRTSNHEQPVTVYSWSDAQQRGIITMTRRPLQGSGPALFLIRPIPGAFSGPPVETIAHGARNVEKWRDWMRRYFQRLHPAPKRIVLDEEGAGINYEAVTRGAATDAARVAVFRRIWDDKAAYARLPEAVKAWSPEDLANRAKHDWKPWLAWRAFAGQVMADTLRRVVYEPAVEVLGPDIAVSNYQDMEYDFPVYNLFEQPQLKVMMGNWSSPSCYLRHRGSRYNRGDKSAEWNSFIDNLNYVRSCLNRSPRVAPWVSYPSYRKFDDKANKWQLRWLWRELVEHIRASGVTTILYWNPTGGFPPWENALAAGTFFKPMRVRPHEKFAPLELNLDEVRTGDKVTRYEDWRRAVDQTALRRED